MVGGSLLGGRRGIPPSRDRPGLTLAKPEIREESEARGVRYVICIPAGENLVRGPASGAHDRL
jgi:hypothetical protein